MDDYDEEIVEETHMLVEFAGNTGNDALKQDNLSMKIIGIDSEQPLIQIGNQLYAGEYLATFGTELVFSETEGHQPTDTVFDTKLDQKLKFAAKTNKKLVIKRAFAKANNSTDDPSAVGITANAANNAANNADNNATSNAANNIE